MAEIDMKADAYALRLKDGDVTWCVDAFALVGEAQRAGFEPNTVPEVAKVAAMVRSVCASDPPGSVPDDAKAFSIGMRVFKYMDSVGNA